MCRKPVLGEIFFGGIITGEPNKLFFLEKPKYNKIGDP